MAEVSGQTPPSLSEEYSLPVEVAADPEAAEVEKVESPVVASSEEAAPEKIEEPEAPVEAEESSVPPAAVAEESSDASDDAAEKSEEPAAEETTEGDDAGEATEEAPEVKLETAPADFRFPTTNQTRHCFTRYVEYHRCVAAKGEDAPECDKFAKYYRSLCPGEWVDRWNEQRENGTFPGPL